MNMDRVKFKDLRKKLMMSERELAEVLGVTRTAVVFWETGFRSVPAPAAVLVTILAKYPGLVPEVQSGEIFKEKEEGT